MGKVKLAPAQAKICGITPLPDLKFKSFVNISETFLENIEEFGTLDSAAAAAIEEIEDEGEPVYVLQIVAKIWRPRDPSPTIQLYEGGSK